MGLLAVACTAGLAACGGGGSSSPGGNGSGGSGSGGGGIGGGGTGGGGTGGTPGSPTDITTYKYNVARTGANTTETLLTVANVNQATFGKLRFLTTNSKVDAQPLYLAGLTVNGAKHNVLFVATENDMVYAFDVDTGSVLWQSSVLPAGETTNDQPLYGCDQVYPEIGVTSTPVIDRTAGPNGTIYLVAMSQSLLDHSYHQRLHALDVTTGAAVLPAKDITATYPTLGGTTTFDPGQYEDRAALLLSQGVIYTTWTSHCDVPPYTGWIIGFSQQTLARTSVLNIAPNSSGSGPAIWMAGGGPAADADGSIYLATANGAFETALDANGFPNQQDFGNSFLRLSTTGGALAVADYFTMYDVTAEVANDQDLGSGGVVLLPDATDAGGTVRHLAVAGGKDGTMYVVERNSMGKFSAGGNNNYQALAGALGSGIWSTPAYFNGSVYYGPTNGTLRSFKMAQALFPGTPTSQSSNTYQYPGTAPSVSANGTSDGIVWTHENSTPAVLHAHDAADLTHELYNSSQAANGRDQFGAGNKFITPVVADGKVFVGTTDGVAVFGLLH